MIQVKFFSSLRELVGQDTVEVDSDTPLTLQQVWQQASPRTAMPANTLCAINMEYAKLEDEAQNNDEVAFFPPVTGG